MSARVRVGVGYVVVVEDMEHIAVCVWRELYQSWIKEPHRDGKKPSSWMTLINNGQDFYLPCERETVRTGVGGVGPLVDLSSANKENACPTGEASQGW